MEVSYRKLLGNRIRSGQRSGEPLLQREMVSDDYTKGFISMQPTPAKHVGSSLLPDQERGLHQTCAFWIFGVKMRPQAAYTVLQTWLIVLWCSKQITIRRYFVKRNKESGCSNTNAGPKWLSGRNWLDRARSRASCSKRCLESFPYKPHRQNRAGADCHHGRFSLSRSTPHPFATRHPSPSHTMPLTIPLVFPLHHSYTITHQL
jgi:hypothetical protein